MLGQPRVEQAVHLVLRCPVGPHVLEVTRDPVVGPEQGATDRVRRLIGGGDYRVLENSILEPKVVGGKNHYFFCIEREY